MKKLVACLVGCLMAYGLKAAPVRALVVDGILRAVDEEKVLILLPDKSAVMTCFWESGFSARNAQGEEIPLDTLKAGASVSAHCLADGARMVVETLVLSGAEASAGAMSELGSETEVVEAEDGGMDVGLCAFIRQGALELEDAKDRPRRRYWVDQGTQLLNGAGQPLPLSQLKLGSTVMLRFVQHDGRAVVTQMVVKG